MVRAAKFHEVTLKLMNHINLKSTCDINGNMQSVMWTLASEWQIYYSYFILTVLKCKLKIHEILSVCRDICCPLSSCPVFIPSKLCCDDPEGTLQRMSLPEKPVSVVRE